MRLTGIVAIFLILSAPALPAGDDEGTAAVAAVQQVFDGMASHDAAKIRAVLLPGAQLFAIRDQGEPTLTSFDDFATRIAGMQGGLLERFTSPPKVLVRGRMAQVWGEYEFLRDGKFNHCGVDTASVFQTASGWKIASLSYTTETKGCPGQ